MDDFELPKMKEEDKNPENEEVKEETVSKDIPKEEQEEQKSEFTDDSYKKEEQIETNSTNEVSNANFDDVKKGFSEDPIIEEPEEKERTPLVPETISIMDEKDDSNKIFSRTGTIIFVCVCIGVVCFCLGALFGFYYGTKNQNNQDTPKEESVIIEDKKTIEPSIEENDPVSTEPGPVEEENIEENPEVPIEEPANNIEEPAESGKIDL